MKKALLSIGLGLLSVLSFAQLSGTYTINSGQATGGTNYNNFSAAVSALGVSGVSGPVTFNVVAATYTETVNFPTAISGTSTTNTVTFQSAAANTSTPVVTSSGNVINMSYGNLNNITFRNIDFVGTGSYVLYSYAAFSTGYSYQNIRFEECKLELANTNGYPVYLYGYFGGAQKLYFDECEIKGGYYGIYAYWYYVGAGSELNINESDMVGFGYMSAYIYAFGGNPKIVLTDNFIQNVSSAANVYGLYTYYTGPGTEISGNRFELSCSSWGYGVLAYYAAGTLADPVKIHNNEILYTGNSTSGLYGLRLGYGTHNKIYHNSTYISNNSTSSYGAYLYYTAFNSGNEYKNNIVMTNGTSPWTIYAYSGSSSYIDMKDNVYYSNSGTTLRMYSALNGTYTTMGAWQTAMSNDAGSVCEDPSFSGPANLIPQAIAIDDLCESVGITNDINGLTRSATSPDPGAHEFSVPTNNAGLTALIAPDAPLCADDTSVVVVLKNTGLVALTTCSLHYELNSTVVLNTLITGNLAPGADTVITLVANTTFTSGSEIRCWSSMPNGVQDSSAMFDTVGTTIYDGLTGTYNIPNDYPTLAAAAADVNLKGVCGHVVMEINSGTYNEQIVLGNILGAAEDATLTWRSANGNPNSATILSNTGGAVVDMNGSDWVTYEGLTIRNNTTGFAGIGVRLTGGAEHVTLDNCIIRTGNAGTTSANLSAVYSLGLNHNLTINNCELLNGGMGLYLYGSGTTSRVQDVTITNTLLKNAYYMQAYMYFVDGLEFHNNTLTNDSNLYLFSYANYMYYVDNFNITGNYIGATGTYFNIASYGGYTYPMYMFYCVGRNFPRSLVANNCINAGREGATTYGYYGMYSAQSGRYNFHNNSVNRVGGQASAFYRAGYFAQGGLVSLKNNSFADYETGVALYINDGFTVFESDNNNLYTNGSTLAHYMTVPYADLAAYQNGTGNDLNSVNTDPSWEDTLACVTCNDTLDNSGTNSSAAMYDIDSNMRSVNTPDIGAKEWVSPANFTLGGDSTYCADEVTIEAGPAQSVTWSVNGNSSTAPTLTLSSNGATTVYNVLVSIQTEFCGSASDNALITLVPNANLDSNTHLCANASTTLNPGGAATASYTWSTGAATQSIVVNQPGTYSVTKDEQGCVSTASTMITQSEAVQILGTEVCSDDLPLNLDATIANGTSYAWSGGSNPTGAMNTFNDGGAYTVTATDAFGCSSIDSFEVVVLEAPEAVITTPSYSGYIYIFDASSSPYLTSSSTVNWNFGIGASPVTSTNISETVTFPWSNPSAPTTYSVSLEINNGCGIDIATMIIAPSLGTEDIEAGQFLVYPNPANDVVTVATNDVDAGNIQILDMSGRIVAELPLNAGSNNHEINVTDLAAGTYIVKVINDKSAVTKQLIIQ